MPSTSTGRRWWRPCAAGLAALTLVLGCSSGEPQTRPSISDPSTPAEDSDTINVDTGFPVRWIPTPALDLNSPDGTFIRGIVESDYRAFRHQSSAALPPGFTDASRDSYRIDDYENGPPQYAYSDPTRSAYFWAIDLPPWDLLRGFYSRAPVPPLAPDMRATAICYYSVDGSPEGPIPALFFTYRHTGTSPPPTQHGPQVAPQTTTFGDWHMTELINPMRAALNEPCKQNPPIPIDQLDTTINSPDPGWPTSGV